jgi:hypothetical protein
MTASFEDVYGALVRRHGADSVVDKAVCRSMARLLADDGMDAKAAAAAAQLAALLPARAEGKPWDLRLLSDRQLAILEKLASVARGERLGTPEHRQKSTKHWLALQIAALLDSAAERTGSPDWRYRTPDNMALSTHEKTQLKSDVSILLSPFRVEDLWRDNFESVFCAERAPAAYVPPEQATPIAEKLPDNVVALPPRGSPYVFDPICTSSIPPCYDATKKDWP